MQRIKRGLASLLAVLMLISLLPSAALALEEETPLTPLPEQIETDGDTQDDVQNDGDTQDDVQNNEDTQDDVQNNEDAQDDVQNDGDTQDDVQNNEDTQDDVQNNGDTQDDVQNNGDAQDDVQNNGDTQGDVPVIVLNGFTVGGKEIALENTEKVEGEELEALTPAPAPVQAPAKGGRRPAMARIDASVTPPSTSGNPDGWDLQKLPTYYARLDLSNELPETLKKVDISAVKNDDSVFEGKKIAAWAKFSYRDENNEWVNARDNYELLGDQMTLDLFTYGYLKTRMEYRTMRLELILGTADQTDTSNIRYYVDVTLPQLDSNDLAKLLTITAKTTKKNPLSIYDSYSWPPYGSNSSAKEDLLLAQLTVRSKDWSRGDEAYLLIAPNTNEAAGSTPAGWFTEEDGITLDVYEGIYKSMKELTDADAPKVDDFTAGDGHLGDYSKSYRQEDAARYTIVFKKGDEVLLVLPTVFMMYGNSLNVSGLQLYDESRNLVNDERVQRDNLTVPSDDDIETYVIPVANDQADGEYYLRLYAYDAAEVRKAVEGKVETDNGETDILTALRGSGHKGNYSGEGKIFTFFNKDGDPSYIRVKAINILNLDVSGLYAVKDNERVKAAEINDPTNYDYYNLALQRNTSGAYDPAYTAKDTFYFGLKDEGADGKNRGLENVEKAVEITEQDFNSNYSSAFENDRDIKDQLFSDPAEGGGYLVSGKSALYFMVRDKNGVDYKFAVNFDVSVSLNFSGLYRETSSGSSTTLTPVGSPSPFTDESGVTTVIVSLPPELSASAGYIAEIGLDVDETSGVTIKSVSPGTLAEDKLSFTHKADYSDGVTFTVTDSNDKTYTMVVKTRTRDVVQYETPKSPDTYFEMEGANVGEDTPLFAAVMPYHADSYYFNGFQTLFLLNNDGTPVDEGTKIKPTYIIKTDKTNIYAGLNQDGRNTTERQESGVTEKDFASGTAIQYSAAAENGTHLKNYWVTFVTQQSGPKLFVNGINDSSRVEDGMPKREVFLTEDYDYHHDIFIANIGDEELTNLSVELDADAQKTLILDKYWNIQSDGGRKLPAFTKEAFAVDPDKETGFASNVAKIRLLPQKNADGSMVSGTIGGVLTIKAGEGANAQEVKIKLSGTITAPKITTEKLLPGVQYVPYSCLIQTNNMYGTNNVVFTPSGNYPAGSPDVGFGLRPNGEIYGVPMTAGTFSVTATATYILDGAPSPYTDSKTFELIIAERKNTNVWEATDPTYNLLQAIVNEDGTLSKQETPAVDSLTGDNSWEDPNGTQLFWSEGPYEDFRYTESSNVNGETTTVEVRNVFLDGERLTPDVDYTSESGSTKITVKNQTLARKGNGTHTIAAEFRVGGTTSGTLKRAAQNYTISTKGISQNTNNGGSSNGSSGGGGASSGTSSPALKPVRPGNSTTPSNPSNPGTSTTPASRFTDVPTTHTFYNDVEWAFNQGLMIGTSDTAFQPRNPISQGTVVLVLARIAGINLDNFDPSTYDNIPNDAVWAKAAVWATQSALLPDGSQFNSEGPIGRGDMAIMLVKYLTSLGVDTTVPENPVAFTDAALMSQDANNAFQVLYRYGVFKGIGNNTMDVAGTTTRGQFSALVHRMSGLVEQ